MGTVVYLSFVTSAIAFAVSETKAFGPVRSLAGRNNAILGNLLSCGYCLSHWVAFAVVAIYQPRLFYAWWLLDYFLTSLVIAWLSGLQWALMCWLMEKAAK